MKMVIQFMKQNEIWLINLDPTIGSEIKKTRPCVVISPNEINYNLKTVIIAPMTTTDQEYPTRIRIKHNNRIGYIVLDQIRTIDKRRIIKRFEQLTGKEIAQVKEIIKELLVD